MAPLPRLVAGRRLGRLHADHLDLRIHRFGDDARPRSAAAATDWHDDHLDVGLLLEDLERIRPNAGDQIRFVARMDVAVAVFLGESSGVHPSLIEIDAMGYDLGPEPVDRLHLDWVRSLGY